MKTNLTRLYNILPILSTASVTLDPKRDGVASLRYALNAPDYQAARASVTLGPKRDGIASLRYALNAPD